MVSLFDHAPVGYLSINEKGLILNANLTIADLLGVNRKSLIGQPLSSYIEPADQDIYYRHRRKLLETGTRQTCDFRLRGTSGDPVWIRTDCVCVGPPGSEGFHLRATLSNITELKQVEEERREIEARMHQAQKLESLGMLAGGIAHDFNNILMVVLGNIDLAMDELSPVSPACESIRLARNSAKRAAELSRQMLIYSGRGFFIKKPIDLNEVVGEMAHLLESVISKKAVLRYDLAAGLPAIEADAAEIRQVVLNLITNASEAIGEDAEANIITVSTGLSGYGFDTPVGGTSGQGPAGEGYVRFDVADTGCGMDEQTRQKIFDPFFSTKFTGRGLGLAAVHGIVQGHGGLLKVASTVGRGSTFTVLFPASLLPAVTAPADEPGEAAAGLKGVVLVADDEEAVNNLEQRSLTRAGFQVLTARDGREAVNVFREHADLIDVVLLDLTMPRMGGADAFREIRKINEDVPVLLASGYTEKQARQNLVDDIRPTGYVQKPCRPFDLVRAVQSALNGKR